MQNKIRGKVRKAWNKDNRSYGSLNMKLFRIKGYLGRKENLYMCQYCITKNTKFSQEILKMLCSKNQEKMFEIL